MTTTPATPQPDQPRFPLQSLMEICLHLSAEQDLDKLMGKILNALLRVTRADAGTLFLTRPGHLESSAARCLSLEQRLGGEKAKGLFTSFTVQTTTESVAGACAVRGETIVLDDVRSLPAGSPFTHNNSFDLENDYTTVSMLAIPMKNLSGSVVGVLQLINAGGGESPTPFFSEDIEIARAVASQAAVAIENARLTASLRAAHLDTLRRLGIAAEWRDKETANHITRVSLYSELLARGCGWDEDNTDLLRIASAMHDVGKVGVPDAIRNKPGKLDFMERAAMEKHCIIGAGILGGNDDPVIALSCEVALGHHEKWDGTGYPNRIAGEHIPESCRIVALADVYDALSTKRPYKEPFSHERCVEIITEGRGTHFEPKIVDIFLQHLDEFLAIRQQFEDHTATAV